jgi:hypothetical protein
MTILAASTVAQKSVVLSRQALRVSQASFLLEEGAEALRVYRDNSSTNLFGGSPVLVSGTDYYPVFSGGTWTFPQSISTVGVFTRKIVISNVYRDSSTNDIVQSGGVLDVNTKLITVTVSWFSGSQNITKTLSFYLASIF